MKYAGAFFTFFLLLLAFGCTNVKLNTFERREQLVADSLRIADSIRVADSKRVGDSLMLARYDSGDNKLREEERRREERREERRVLDSIALANADTSSYKSANVSKEIIIDEDNPNAEKINTIQAKIDSIKTLIYENDKKYMEMKEYTLRDKKAYMKFLLRHHMKDTLEVLTCCKNMYELRRLEQEKLQLILDTQRGNIRATINLYIKKAKLEMGDIGRFIYSLTDDVPEEIKHEKNKNWDL